VGPLAMELARIASRACGIQFRPQIGSEVDATEEKQLLQVGLLLNACADDRLSLASLVHLYPSVGTDIDYSLSFSLAVFPLNHAFARRLWAQTHSVASTCNLPPHHSAVLAMTVDEAHALFLESVSLDAGSAKISGSTIDFLADALTLRAVLGMAKDAFVHSVRQIVEEKDSKSGHDALKDRDVVDGTNWLLRLVGDYPSKGRDYVQTWQSLLDGEGRTGKVVAEPGSNASALDFEHLINALALLRLVSHSPTSVETMTALALRQALATRVFASDSCLEDARDLIIDYIHSKIDT